MPADDLDDLDERIDRILAAREPRPPSRVEILQVRIQEAQRQYLSAAVGSADARELRRCRAQIREFRLALQATIEAERESGSGSGKRP